MQEEKEGTHDQAKLAGVAYPDAHQVAHPDAQQHDLLPSGREWFQILNIKGRIKKSFEYFSSTTDKIVPNPTPTSSS